MDFESRLKNLDVMYQTKELSYSVEIKKEIDYRSLFYIEMKLLLEKNLKKNYSEENYQVFLDNIDIVLKYTNESNMEWIYYECLYQDDRFIEALSNNIGSIRFKHHLCFIIVRICNAMSEYCDCRKLLNNRVLDHIMKLSYPFSVSTFGLVFDKLDEDGIIEFLKLTLKYHKMIDFSHMEYEKYGDRVNKFIQDNALEFAHISSNMFALKEIVSNNLSSLKKLDTYYKDKSMELATLLARSIDIGDFNQTIKDIVLFIVYDIIVNENATFSGISWRMGGSYSNLVYIKNKILKYGFERSTETFPNNPYIVKPLLRKIFEEDGKKLYLEVVQLAKTGNISEDDMYFLYKHFRELNIIWKDVKKDNVGYLLEDNIIHWNKSLNPSDSALGLREYRGCELLKKGDIVLLDADDLYDLNDDYVSHNKSKYFDDFFEKRYQDEILKKTKKVR